MLGAQHARTYHVTRNRQNLRQPPTLFSKNNSLPLQKASLVAPLRSSPPPPPTPLMSRWRRLFPPAADISFTVFQFLSTITCSLAVAAVALACCRPVLALYLSSKTLGLAGGVLMAACAIHQVIAFSLAVAMRTWLDSCKSSKARALEACCGIRAGDIWVRTFV